MKASLLIALALISAPAFAGNYECRGDNGSKMTVDTLPYMVTVISPSIKPFQFITHGVTKNGRVSLIGEKKHGGTTDDEMWIDAGLLKDDRTGTLSFQAEEYRCSSTGR